MIFCVIQELERRIKKRSLLRMVRPQVTKITRIILKCLANKAEWEKHWQEEFGDNLNVVILFKTLNGSP